jgi:hypothetical protein
MARCAIRFFLLLVVLFPVAAQEEFLRIESAITPTILAQGEEGVLRIRIIPRWDIKISSYPEFMIRLEENDNLSFAKMFFVGSELNFQSRQANNVFFLDVEKDVEIPFRVRENALLGKYAVNGEIIFTALFQDSWFIKTFQKFSTAFIAKKNLKIKKK